MYAGLSIGDTNITERSQERRAVSSALYTQLEKDTWEHLSNFVVMELPESPASLASMRRLPGSSSRIRLFLPWLTLTRLASCHERGGNKL